MNPTKFLLEFIMRFAAKSPKFFQILQVVFGSLTFASWLPSMLQRWFNVEVPGHIITMCEDVAKYATGFFAATLLPADTKPVALTDDGSVLKKTNEKKLPYTANVEEKQAAKELQQSSTVPENVEMKIDDAKKDKE